MHPKANNLNIRLEDMLGGMATSLDKVIESLNSLSEEIFDNIARDCEKGCTPCASGVCPLLED